MMRRTLLRSKQPPPWAKPERVYTPSTIRPLTQGTYAGSLNASAPKTVPYRDPHLLALARGQECLLRVPGVCQGGTETTVAAHSNLLIHGKAKGRKADDQFSAWSCAACHTWLDRGGASHEAKTARFMFAHAQQVLEWRQIAVDQSRPLREQVAASAALEQLRASAPVVLWFDQPEGE